MGIETAVLAAIATDVLIGSVAGAGLGAATSAITGSDIGEGAMWGGIGGGLTGGIGGGLVEGAGLGEIAGYGIGGGVSGLLTSGIRGTDPIMGGLTGAASGALGAAVMPSITEAASSVLGASAPASTSAAGVAEGVQGITPSAMPSGGDLSGLIAQSGYGGGDVGSALGSSGGALASTGNVASAPLTQASGSATDWFTSLNAGAAPGYTATPTGNVVPGASTPSGGTYSWATSPAAPAPGAVSTDLLSAPGGLDPVGTVYTDPGIRTLAVSPNAGGPALVSPNAGGPSAAAGTGAGGFNYGESWLGQMGVPNSAVSRFVAANPLTSGGLALGGGMLLNSMMKGDQMPKGYDEYLAAQKQMSDQATQAMGYLNSGKLPAGQQAALDRMAKNEEAAVRSNYARMGMSGSTAEADALQQIQTNRLIAQQNAAMGMYQTGAQMAGMNLGALQNILKMNQAAEADMSRAISDFASNLVGAGRLRVA